ncbi:hypothetical protein KY289_001604 [Solanum tuberosum]|nr:hypothetical protein KY289_001604 [Solanum tuberosum]
MSSQLSERAYFSDDGNVNIFSYLNTSRALCHILGDEKAYIRGGPFFFTVLIISSSITFNVCWQRNREVPVPVPVRSGPLPVPDSTG